MTRFILMPAVLLLVGCAAAPMGTMAVYDLGPPPATPATAPVSALPVTIQISAPTWLDSPSIFYRLAYVDPARLNAYGASRWAGSPTELLAYRLRALPIGAARGMGGSGEQRAYVMHAELERFEQIFDAPDSSLCLVQLTASVVEAGTRQPVAQRVFRSQIRAQSPDAKGGVRGLIEASDQVIMALTEWVATLP